MDASATPDAGRGEGLAKAPVCPWCGQANDTAERVHDGNRMQAAELVEAMLTVYRRGGREVTPHDRMTAALGVAMCNAPYLAALGDGSGEATWEAAIAWHEGQIAEINRDRQAGTLGTVLSSAIRESVHLQSIEAIRALQLPAGRGAGGERP